MKILMISPQFHPLVGGYERSAERLSAALAAKGHEITIVTERRASAWPARERRYGALVRRLWCRYKPRQHRVTSGISLLWFLVAEGRKYDVWHVHQYGLSAALASGLGFILGRPVVLKLTNTAGMGIGSTVRTRLGRFLHRRVEAVAAVSPETRSEALVFGIPEDRIHLLGNGVDISTFFPRDSETRARLVSRFGFSGKSVAISVARLAPEKNPDGLLRAWAEAAPHVDKEWVLVFVGDGPMKSRLEEMSQDLGLAARVFFLGRRDDIDALLAASDLYVSASHWEGLSNSLLEAMASGLPSLLTRVSAVKELVEEPGAGTVVPVGDPEALRDGLVRMVSQAETRAAMGHAARETILARYSIEAVAVAYERLYQRLAERK